MFSMFHKQQESKAQQIILSDQAVIKNNVGIFYGDVYFIKISSDKEDKPNMPDDLPSIDMRTATDLLNHLDKQPGSRQANHLINFFTSGNFILARTDQYALNHHHLYAKSLHRPTIFMQHLFETLQNLSIIQPTSLDQFLIQPIRQTLGKGMLELKSFPIELNKALTAFSTILDDSSQTFEDNVKFNLTTGRIPKEMLYLFPGYRKAKKEYLNASSAFLFSQREVIFNEIKNIADNKNSYHIVALTILELIKEEYPSTRSDQAQLHAFLNKLSIQEIDVYLKHPDIITIPASITAGDNLMIILSCALSALYQNAELRNNLQIELEKMDFLSLLEKKDINGIRNLFEKDAHHNGLLHRIYLEAMRRENIYKSPEHLSVETLQNRYTTESITIGNYRIPGNSTIIFLPAMPRFDKELWIQPELFNPDRFKEHAHLDKYSLSIFSMNKRRCPAHHMTSYMFKLFLTYISTYYDLNLDISQGTRLSQIKVNGNPIDFKKISTIENRNHCINGNL